MRVPQLTLGTFQAALPTNHQFGGGAAGSARLCESRQMDAIMRWAKRFLIVPIAVVDLGLVHPGKLNVMDQPPERDLVSGSVRESTAARASFPAASHDQRLNAHRPTILRQTSLLAISGLHVMWGPKLYKRIILLIAILSPMQGPSPRVTCSCRVFIR